MPERVRRIVDSLRLKLAPTSVWADVMILADRFEQDPKHVEIPGNLSALVETELRRRRAHGA